MTPPTPLSAAELAEIAERAEKATKAPWHTFETCIGYVDTETPEGEPDEEEVYGWFVTGPTEIHGDNFGEEVTFWNEADSTFVAAARSDIPALLAHAAALAEENATLTQHLAQTIDNYSAAIDAVGKNQSQLAAARATIERQRPVVEASTTFYDYWMGEDFEIDKIQDYSDAWLAAMKVYRAAPDQEATDG